MPATSRLMEALMNGQVTSCATMCALLMSAQAVVRYDRRSKATSSAWQGPAMTAMFSTGTPYTFWKYSDTMRFSSGTIPLMADMMNFPLISAVSLER